MLEEQSQARINLKAFNKPEGFEDKMDAFCVNCIYTCKQEWNTENPVGPLCPVLWLFSPKNRMRLLND